MRLVNFSEKELYEALGFFIVIAIALLTFGLFSKNNLLVNASVAIGTIAMTVFIAYQAFVTRKSIEEMRKERLTPIVIDAINALISIENKIKANFKIIEKDLSNPKKLEEIKEEIQKPEVKLVDKLLGIDLYRELKRYQSSIKTFKKRAFELQDIITRIGGFNVITTLGNIEQSSKVDIFSVVPILRSSGNFNEIAYKAMLDLIREYYRDETARDIYEKFKTELIRKEDYIYKELVSCLSDLLLAMNILREEYEEDKEKQMDREKKIKMIENAIDKLYKEYIT